MAFASDTKTAYSWYGIPYLWNSGDEITAPSNATKIVGSDTAHPDRFGQSIAVGSNRIVVGAPQDADNGSNSGSAYVFDLNGNQIAKIKPSDGAAGDVFGDINCVAVGNGRIVVSADQSDPSGITNAGAVYVWDLNGNFITKITASDKAASDFFGASVAVGNGRIVVGATGDDDNGSASGSAYIFDLNGNQLAKIKPSGGASNDFFGSSVAVGSGRIVVGAYGNDYLGAANCGTAYIFDLSGKQLYQMRASDYAASDVFGWSVAIGAGVIVVGSWGDFTNSGSAYIFDLGGYEVRKIRGSSTSGTRYFGHSVSVGSGRIVVGAYQQTVNSVVGAGAAYVFDLNGSQISMISSTAPEDTENFGHSVSVGSGKIVSGAPGSGGLSSTAGAAYIFNTPEVFTPYDVADLNSQG